MDDHLGDRIVEVIADLDDGSHRYGSGCIVNQRFVLTAAHLIRARKGQRAKVRVRDNGKVEHKAKVRHCGDETEPDLAILEILSDDAGVLQNRREGLSPLPIATLARRSSRPEVVAPVHVIGYPQYAELREGQCTQRDRVHVYGSIPVLSHLDAAEMSVQVVQSPPAMVDKSSWSGLSGGPVFADNCLLGVIHKHSIREGQSTLTAVPVCAVLSREPKAAMPSTDWGRWLGLKATEDVRQLPAHHPPPYFATFQSLATGARHDGAHQELTKLIVEFSKGTKPALWLLGEAYSGKSTLLREFITERVPSDVDVVYYFLSRATSDADGNRFISAVVPQLAALCREGVTHQGRDELVDLWVRAGQQARMVGRHLLLVVDGVDEDSKPPGVPTVMDLLPRPTIANTHLLVSARKKEAAAQGHPLNDARALEVEAVGVTEPLPAESEIDALLTADTVDCLGNLAAAAGPIAERDLAALIFQNRVSPTGSFESEAKVLYQVRAILRAGGRSFSCIVNDSESGQAWCFAHNELLRAAQSLLKAQSTPEGLDLLKKYQMLVRQWAAVWGSPHAPGGIPWPYTTEHRTPRYLLDAYPHTLVDEPELLALLVTDIGWVDSAIRAVGVEQVLSVLLTARSPSLSARLGTATRESVSTMLAVVRGEARHLTADEVHQPGFVLRHLAMHASELGDENLVADCNERLRAGKSDGLLLDWTTRILSRAFVGESESCGSEILAMTVRSDGHVVTVGHDGRVLVWEPRATGSEPILIGRHEGAARAVAETSSGRVVTGGDDRCIRVWPLPSSESHEPLTLTGHAGPVRAIVALPDDRIVTSGHDGWVLLWDLRTGSTTAPRRVGLHPSAVRGVTVTAGGGAVVTGGDDGQILEWRLPVATKDVAERDEVTEERSPVPKSLGVQDGPVLVIAPVAGTMAILTGGDDRRVLLRNATPSSDPIELGDHREAIRALLVGHDDSVISMGCDGRIILRMIHKPGVLVEVGRHGTAARALAQTNDGLLVSGGADGRIRVWDVVDAVTGRHRITMSPDEAKAPALAVSLHGRVVSGGADGLLRVWDSSGLVASQSVGGGRVQAVVISPEGRILSRTTEGLLHLWSGKPDEPAALIGAHPGSSGLVALVGERLVSGGFDGQVLLWDLLAPTKPPTRVGGHDTSAVTAIASLGSGHVVSGDSSGRLAIWALNPCLASTAKPELPNRKGSHAAVGALATRTRTEGTKLLGFRIVVGSDDGSVLLYSSDREGEPTAWLGNHAGPVTGATFLPDGRIATNGRDGLVRSWLDSSNLLEPPSDASAPPCLLATSTVAFATTTHWARTGSTPWYLALAHSGGGISKWSWM